MSYGKEKKQDCGNIFLVSLGTRTLSFTEDFNKYVSSEWRANEFKKIFRF